MRQDDDSLGLVALAFEYLKTSTLTSHLAIDDYFFILRAGQVYICLMADYRSFQD